MKNLAILFLGKLLIFFSKNLKLGAGSTWPGHIALKLNDKFTRQIIAKNHHLKVVFIAGTNGKTTTTKLLQQILEEKGLKVFRNASGANLLNGAASVVIEHATLSGHLPYDAALMEVDENTLPVVLSRMSPHALILLNLFRDQLDRYGEVNTILKKWTSAVQKMSKSTQLILNGDDPSIASIGRDRTENTFYFGVEESLMKKKELSHDTDFTYCPLCSTKLKFDKISYSHVGKYFCSKCKFTNPKKEVFSEIANPLLGLYNKYNINAASLAAQQIFEVDEKTIQKAVLEFTPAFGRQEQFEYKGKKLFVLLAKNPAGFNQSIEAITNSKKDFTVHLVLNDRIPDGMDVSWIWDVDFDNLSTARKIFISGDRAYDMGLRIKYSQIPDTKYQILENLEQAIDTSVKQTEKDETLFILPTYSAMLDVRKILTGRKIL